jgi:hypothetical protein
MRSQWRLGLRMDEGDRETFHGLMIALVQTPGSAFRLSHWQRENAGA